MELNGSKCKIHVIVDSICTCYGAVFIQSQPSIDDVLCPVTSFVTR